MTASVEGGAGTTRDVATLPVSGLQVHAGALWLTSIREQLVARATPPDALAATIVLTYAHPVADIALAPDGVWLVTGGGSAGRQCVRWSLADGEQQRFDCPDGAGGGLAYYRDRLCLTHRHNRRLLILDPASGAVERRIATEHEVFSPAVSPSGELWLVEAETGAFGRFSPASETRYFFSRFDLASERAVERYLAPAAPGAMATDGVRFWCAPRGSLGVVVVPRSVLSSA